MLVQHDSAAMRQWAEGERQAGHTLALVPTMGFLHEGHLALVRAARRRGDTVSVSIFVNPTQFGPQEDLARYPRDLDGDLEKLRTLGVDAVFVPNPAAIYPPGFDTFIEPGAMAQPLCGASRPGHFRGVCTVVHLLFRICLPHVAVFGQKDYQQLQIIRQMTRDLRLDVDIVGVPTVREADGLALSSRNAYLSASERQQATCLWQALQSVQREVLAGERVTAKLLACARAAVARAHAARIDYIDICDRENLAPLAIVDRPAVCALAVFIGTTRLIDNIELSLPE